MYFLERFWERLWRGVWADWLFGRMADWGGHGAGPRGHNADCDAGVQVAAFANGWDDGLTSGCGEMGSRTSARDGIMAASAAEEVACGASRASAEDVPFFITHAPRTSCAACAGVRDAYVSRASGA